MVKLQYKNMPIFKSKRTSAFYKQFWSGIQKLIGDDIKTVIGK